MSSNDCDGDNNFFLAVGVVLLSSLTKDGNDLLSLMLFMVAATLGIALVNKTK